MNVGRWTFSFLGGFPRQTHCRRAIAAAVLLALALTGLPLAGVLLMGHRLRDYLEFPPLTRYVAHAHFSWWVFTGLALFTFLALFPFIRSFLRTQPPPQSAADPQPVVFRLLFGDPMPVRSPRRFSGWGWLALAVLGVAWLLAWTRFAWFAPLQRHTFIPLWLACIGILNALTQQRLGSCLLIRRPRFFLTLFPASAIFWWFFEYLNRFTQNWYYRGVENMSGAQYAVLASISFATVLPAVLSLAEWLATFPRLQRSFDFAGPAGRAAPGPAIDRYAAAWGVLLLAGSGLALLGVYPNALFPLLWLAPLAMSIAAQHLLGHPSVLCGVRTGDWRVPATFALAALLCGFLWETWNLWSCAKWVYSVPYVQRFHLFEMPVLGYAGYLPFGVECAAAALWLEILKTTETRTPTSPFTVRTEGELLPGTPFLRNDVLTRTACSAAPAVPGRPGTRSAVVSF